MYLQLLYLKFTMSFNRVYQSKFFVLQPLPRDVITSLLNPAAFRSLIRAVIPHLPQIVSVGPPGREQETVRKYLSQ